MKYFLILFCLLLGACNTTVNCNATGTCNPNINVTNPQIGDSALQLLPDGSSKIPFLNF